MNIEIIKGDITELDVDVIVSPANSSLLGGGGCDGAIHRAAGPGLLRECAALGGCPTGEARITRGHNLKARYVIHAVGPHMGYTTLSDGVRLLASAYISSLKVTEKHDLETVAFPCISVGVYRFPVDLAAKIALRAISGFLARHPKPSRVILVAFDDLNHEALINAQAEIKNTGS